VTSNRRHPLSGETSDPSERDPEPSVTGDPSMTLRLRLEMVRLVASRRIRRNRIRRQPARARQDIRARQMWAR